MITLPFTIKVTAAQARLLQDRPSDCIAEVLCEDLMPARGAAWTPEQEAAVAARETAVYESLARGIDALDPKRGGVLTIATTMDLDVLIDTCEGSTYVALAEDDDDRLEHPRRVRTALALQKKLRALGVRSATWGDREPGVVVCVW